jgi:hypothetical protein
MNTPIKRARDKRLNNEEPQRNTPSNNHHLSSIRAGSRAAGEPFTKHKPVSKMQAWSQTPPRRSRNSHRVMRSAQQASTNRNALPRDGDKQRHIVVVRRPRSNCFRIIWNTLPKNIHHAMAIKKHGDNVVEEQVCTFTGAHPSSFSGQRPVAFSTTRTVWRHQH